MDPELTASENKDDTRAQENHELRRLVTIYETIIAGVIGGDISVDVPRRTRADVYDARRTKLEESCSTGPF